MNLAIDIGNTQVKLALFEADRLLHVFSGEEEIEKILTENKVRHAIVSKTGYNEGIQNILRQHHVLTFFLTHDLKLPIKILYHTPETLGADRIAGSAACHLLYPKQNILKIDFGTCITYDFITNSAELLGGAISPGMMMRFKALHNYTAKLPLIDPMQFTTFELTGTDTATSILSGVVHGIVNEVSGIIKQYDARYGHLAVVVTGGDSGWFATLLKCKIFARPHLVLEGLNYILNHNLE